MTEETTPFEGAEFRAVFDGAPDAFLIVDRGGVIRVTNDEAERLFGYAREDLVGQPVEFLVPETFRASHETVRGAFAEKPTKRPMGIGRELFARRSDGSLLPVEIGLSPVETRHGTFILAVVHDITERRRLRAFGSGVLQGAEEERQRIARELHDDTAQALAALVLRLQMARRTEDLEKRERMLGQLHEDIHRTSDGVRRILRGLRPPLLEESGLEPALLAHAKSAIADAGVEISFEADDVDHLLTSEAKLAIYRIVQEAISNVLRHAEAGRIELELRDEGDAVRLHVEDDGVGFDPERAGPLEGRGLGLLGLMERAAIVGGVASVESTPGTGTRISVTVPVRSEPGADAGEPPSNGT